MKHNSLVALWLTGVAILSLGYLLYSEYAVAPTITPDETTSIATTTTNTSSIKDTVPPATTTPPISSGVHGSFDVPFTIAIGGHLTLPDGLTITLSRIDDSRCKPNVQCIWAGELSPTLTITGGKLGTHTTVVQLGTVRTPFLATQYYSFELKHATETNITLVTHVIIPSPAPRIIGTLVGTITLGPICPVVREGEHCDPTPEMFTSRAAVVFAADGATEVARQPLSATGTYSFTLEQGSYFVQIQPAGIGAGEKKPVTVTGDATTTVNFDIDTGIR
jgi:hypothetical protein